MAAHISAEKRDEILSLAHLPIFEIIRNTGTTRNTVSGVLAKAGLGPAARPTVTHDQFTAYDPKPRIRVKAYNEPRYTTPFENVDKVIRVCVVADTHDSPDMQQHRFDYIGRWVADEAPDHFVHLGDWSDMTFASRFEGRETLNGRDKPPFLDELDSLRSAIERVQTPIAKMANPPKLTTTLGNHCERAWLFESAHPEVEGMLWAPFMSALSEWDVHQYRQYAFIGGVGFTHVPQTIMNKPYGGKASENAIGNDATFSTVYGHTHRAVYKAVAKNGPNNQVVVFNPGAAMDYGYLKPYAQLATTGWTWGVGTLEIYDGRIIGHSMVSMLELARRYG